MRRTVKEKQRGGRVSRTGNDSKAPIHVFALGMAFRCSRQYKKALIKYGLKTHRHLNFIKDEKTRVRAICTWTSCNWLIYGSKTSRSEWFKVVRFDDVGITNW